MDEEEEFPDIYHGSQRSTWKYRNRDAIQCKQAVDEIENENLSLHLYAAQRLDQTPVVTGRPRRKKGNQEYRAENDKHVWRPPKYWTAWPMPPHLVPREAGYEPGATILNLPPPYINIPVKPSMHLEEVLLAQTMRIAKVQFNAREWDYTDPPPPPRKRQRRDSGTTTDTDNPSTIHPKILSNPERQFRPTILEDDTKTLSLLQPSIRHILSRFDTLLATLHASRRSYALASARSNSADRSRSESQSRSRSRGRSLRPRQRSGTPAPPGLGQSNADVASASETESAGKAMAESNEDHDDDDDGEGDGDWDRENKEDGKGKGRKRSFSSRQARSRARAQKLGLRDWEDVLSFAAVSGWKGKEDMEVVRRVGERCERLLLHPYPHSQAMADLGEGTLERGDIGGAGREGTRRGKKKGKSKPSARSEEQERRTEQQGRRWQIMLHDEVDDDGEAEGDVDADADADAQAGSDDGETTAMEASSLDNDDESEVDSDGVHIDSFLRPIKRKRRG